MNIIYSDCFSEAECGWCEFTDEGFELNQNAADLRKIVHSVKQSLQIGIHALVRLNLYFDFNSQCKTYFFQNTCIKYLCFEYSCIARYLTNV